MQWLCRYSRPKECVHDNGPEYMGHEFQELLSSFGIKSRPTTVKNPTTQAVVERLHLTLADQLRTRVFDEDWQRMSIYWLKRAPRRFEPQRHLTALTLKAN